MKSLHVIDLMAVGGAQFLIKGIFETYQNPDHYLFVLRKTDNLIEVNHPNVFYAKSRSKFGLSSFFQLKKCIKKYDIQILHAYLLKSQIFCKFLKQFWFRKKILILHELGEIFMNNAAWYIQFMRRSNRFTDLYFAASDSTVKALIEKAHIPEKKIIPLYNYVITDDFKREKISIDIDSKKEELNIHPDEFVIGFAGRLSYEKGPIHLINSLPFIEHKLKLVIAGVGNQFQMLQKRAEDLRLSDKIIFLGFVKNMINTYALFDVLVIPSEHESFGLVAVEAQSMEIPVIASDVPGLNEVVIESKSGLQFESKNTKMLAEKLSMLIENKSLQDELKNKGKEFARQFDIESYYNNMLKAYEILLNPEIA
jgi:glycosyltransferase involved in cell wall biosynthesis